MMYMYITGHNIECELNKSQMMLHYDTAKIKNSHQSDKSYRKYKFENYIQENDRQ
jgi:hypothetical protein